MDIKKLRELKIEEVPAENTLSVAKFERLRCEDSVLIFDARSAGEFADFCRLFEQLATTMNQMAEELMEEERIACEAESELLWLEVEGYPTFYSLRLILHQGRRCEGNWTEQAVCELRQEVQRLKLF